MNSSKRQSIMQSGVFCIILFFILLPCTPEAVAQDFLGKVWSVALTRRAVPLEILKSQETITSSVVALKLDTDIVVFTLKGGIPETDLAYVLGEGYMADNRVFVCDAVILLPKETPEDFVKNNYRFVVFDPEVTDFFKDCWKTGIEMTKVVGGVAHGVGGTIYESNHRLASYLNRWAEFLGKYKKQNARATTFLNTSLSLQIVEIRKLVNTKNAKDLELIISYFDNSHPLAILDIGEPLVGLDKDILIEYLKTLVYARGKLIAFYPNHEEKFERENLLLKKITGQ